MRAIERGLNPLDEVGNAIKFKKYQQARGHLITRLGAYCSYCERSLGGNIAVEHIQPKCKNPSLETNWDNLLIACVNCNSIKGDTTIDVNHYIWPDSDNTLLAFIYVPEGMISISPLLPESIKKKALKTIKLTGLDRYPSYDPYENPEMSDTRWRERRNAIERAVKAKKHLQKCDSKEMRSQIIETAQAVGFFSIWFGMFVDDIDMIDRLIKSFPGTSTDCFDNRNILINRPGGCI